MTKIEPISIFGVDTQGVNFYTSVLSYDVSATLGNYLKSVLVECV